MQLPQFFKQVLHISTGFYKSLSQSNLIFGLVFLFLSATNYCVYMSFFTLSWPSEFESIIRHRDIAVFNVVLGAALLLSLILRFSTQHKDQDSWRYLSIVTFSLVGSVVVALITAENRLQMPAIWALAISLFHVGYWSWRREHNERVNYETKMENMTTDLTNYVNTMPKEDAFRLLGETTKAKFNFLYTLDLMAKQVNSIEQQEKLAEYAKEEFKKGLQALCQIASLWTISKTRIYEGNVMVALPSSDAPNAPNAREAFENGKYFFHDMTTLDTVEHCCKQVLYIVPQLTTSISSNNSQPTPTEPFMLPVGLKSEIHPGSIKGAPECVEKNEVVSIDINEIENSLPDNYVGQRLNEIKEYYKLQTDWQSVLCIPLHIKGLKNTADDFTNGVNPPANGVINLYRSEKGSVKSPELFYELTAPLVQLLENLLYLYLAHTPDDGSYSPEFCTFPRAEKDEGIGDIPTG